jgi:ubiquitin carboxyl-terminal hydrolase 5/13
MEVLQANLSKINIPTAATSLYKDECVYTFHTPVRFALSSVSSPFFLDIRTLWTISNVVRSEKESEGGLLIDLNSFLGFSPEYALLNFQRTGHAVYLNISKKRVPKKRVRSQ